MASVESHERRDIASRADAGTTDFAAKAKAGEPDFAARLATGGPAGRLAAGPAPRSRGKAPSAARGPAPGVEAPPVRPLGAKGAVSATASAIAETTSEDDFAGGIVSGTRTAVGEKARVVVAEKLGRTGRAGGAAAGAAGAVLESDDFGEGVASGARAEAERATRAAGRSAWNGVSRSVRQFRGARETVQAGRASRAAAQAAPARLPRPSLPKVPPGTAQRVANAFKGAGGAVVRAASSPIAVPAAAVAGVVLVVVIVVVLLVGAAAGGSAADGLEGNEAICAQYLLAEGFDEAHVAAIMGNFACESGCNPRQVQHGFGYCRDADGNGVEDCSEQAEYPPDLVDNPVAGYGLAQWTAPSRSRGLVAYAQEQGGLSGDWDVQVGYFAMEFEPHRAAFEEIESVSEATRWFHEVYEISADTEENIQRRVDEALRIYAALTAGGSAAGYLQLAISIAEDDTNTYVWGAWQPPYFDCSGLVSYVLMESGFPISGRFSTANQGAVLTGMGFSEHAYEGTEGLVPGDILVKDATGPEGHTAIYVGDGKIVEASSHHPGNTAEDIRVCDNWTSWDVYYRLEK